MGATKNNQNTLQALYSKFWNSSTGGNKRTGGKLLGNNKRTGWNKRTPGNDCKLNFN